MPKPAAWDDVVEAVVEFVTQLDGVPPPLNGWSIDQVGDETIWKDSLARSGGVDATSRERTITIVISEN